MIDLSLDNNVFIKTKLDAALQELDILFNTENTELIGYPEFGTNWTQFLWQMSPSPNDLRSYIYEKIADTFFLSQLTVDVAVNVMNYEYDGMYHVQISISDGLETKYRNYDLK